MACGSVACLQVESGRRIQQLESRGENTCPQDGQSHGKVVALCGGPEEGRAPAGVVLGSSCGPGVGPGHLEARQCRGPRDTVRRSLFSLPSEVNSRDIRKPVLSWQH